ncbi:MAG: MBL fold metallo-hydrolase [Clostridia bacterium]
MRIETLQVGDLDTNCYIVRGETGAVVIDPGADADRIINHLGGGTLSAVLLTHGHFDHIGAVAALAEKTGAKIYMNKNDEPMIADPRKSLSFMTGAVPRPFSVDVFVNDGDVLTFGDLRFKVMHTPGHSGGGVCYAIGNVVFGGDLIFRCSIGRFDYGSYTDEIASVKRVLSSFPGDTVIYPGHGPYTTVDYENKYNPYVKNEGQL